MSYPAEPVINLSVGLTVSGTSSRVELPKGYSSFRISNTSASPAYAKLGDSSVVATASVTGNMIINPGITEMLTLRSPVSGGVYLAAIGTDGEIGITPCAGGI